MSEQKQMVFKQSWDEFRTTGLLWWINTSLHLFGWAIVVQVEEDGTISDVYPARVKFRGFDNQDTEQGYITLTDYLKKNIAELAVEVAEEPSPGIVLPDEAGPDPRWEVVSDEDGVMHHVRWSKPNSRGEYFMCAHYPQLHFAESQARRWNDEGKSPYEFREYRAN